MLKVRLLFSIFILSVFMIGCHSIKPTSSKSAKKYYETFFVGEEGTQYFLKPIELTEENKESRLVKDFTFRYKDQIKDSVTVNFSLYSTEIYKTIDKIHFSNGIKEIEINNISLLYNEKDDKEYISRFSYSIPLSSLHTLYNKQDWHIVINTSDKSLHYYPSDKTQKILKSLQEEIFIMM